MALPLPDVELEQPEEGEHTLEQEERVLGEVAHTLEQVVRMLEQEVLENQE